MEKIDKSAFKIIRSSHEWEESNCYWLDKTPQMRLEALEFLRQQYIKGLNLPQRLDKTIVEIHYGK